jgi:oligopeptide transport system permease protein
MHEDDFTLLDLEGKHALLQASLKPLSAKKMLRHRGLLFGLGILFVLLIFAIITPALSPYEMGENHLIEKNTPPNIHHIFGTDDLGRDVCTRVACGLRISLAIGLIAAFLDLFIGVSWGSISGYLGGVPDQIMMRLADFVYCVPFLLSTILVSALLGPGISSILLAMCLIGWIQMARLVRAQTLAIKQLDFITAARALGVRPLRIIVRHILPNISGPLLALLMLTIPHAIFAEAFLSFLGIGIQPPLASLGSMTADGLQALRFYPWRLFCPSITITLTIFSCNLIADGLRDLLDPTQKKLIGRVYA